MRKKKFDKKAIEEAIKGSNGLILTIAQRLNVSRTTVRNYLREYPDLEELFDDEKGNLLDFAESKLIKKVHEEEAWAIKYVLDKRTSEGQTRGKPLPDWILL